jgi:hypothetical protein
MAYRRIGILAPIGTAGLIIVTVVGVSIQTDDSGSVDNDNDRWRFPSFHQERQEEMNAQDADGPILFQVRTESRGDVPILETSNQTYIEHQDRIQELVNSGEWDELEQYGSLTEEAETVVSGEGIQQLLEEEL